MSGVPLIGEMSITDEHVLLPIKTKMKQILSIIRDEPGTAIILHERKMRIVGVITALDIEEAANSGKNRKKLKGRDIMSSHILELLSDLPLDQAVEEIQNEKPDAVIIRHTNGDFAGFFSITDYHDAQDMLAEQQEAAEQFAQRTSELEDTIQELHDEIEDEDIQQPPYEEESVTGVAPHSPPMPELEMQHQLEPIEDDESYIPAEMRHLPLSPHILRMLKATAEARKVEDRAKKEREIVVERVGVQPPHVETSPVLEQPPDDSELTEHPLHQDDQEV